MDTNKEIQTSVPEAPSTSGSWRGAFGIFIGGLAGLWLALLATTSKLLYMHSAIVAQEVIYFEAMVVMVAAFTLNQFRGLSPLDVKPIGRKYLLGRVVAGALTNICYMGCMKLTSISKGLTIYFANPMFVALFGYLFNQEKLTKYDFISIVCCILGVVITLNPFENRFGSSEGETRSSYLDFLGQLVALAGSIGHGATMTFIRKLSGRVDSITSIFYWGLGNSLIAPLFFFAYQPLAGTTLTFTLFEVKMILVIGFLAYIAQICQTLSYFFEKAGRAAPAGLLQLVFVCFFDIAIIGSDLHLNVLLGSSLIFGSNFIIAILKTRNVVN